MAKVTVLDVAAATRGLTILTLLLFGPAFLIASTFNGLDGLQGLAGCACLIGACKGVI